MTIREVLVADWTVDRFQVTVREKETTKYIMQYHIGKDVKAGKSNHFSYEAECGDVYNASGLRIMIMERIIQYRQQTQKPQGKEMCVGVLLKEIPKEILDLTIEYMHPYHCGNSDNMHGYCFDCYVDTWNGIPGENKQIELNELN